MTFDAPTITAIGVLIGTAGGVVVLVVNAFANLRKETVAAVNAVGSKADEAVASVETVKAKIEESVAISADTAQKTVTLVEKSTEIAGKVDGHLSTLTEELRIANVTIKEGATLQRATQDLVNQMVQAMLTNGKSAHAPPMSFVPGPVVIEAPQKGDVVSESPKPTDIKDGNGRSDG